MYYNNTFKGVEYELGGNKIIKIIINKDRCNGCGECIKVCKSRSLEIRDSLCIAVRPEDCKLCMLCKVTCPVQTIEIKV